MTEEATKDPGLGSGGQISRQCKRDAELRLPRGGHLELVSRSMGVTAATLSGWCDVFLAGEEAALATKPVNAEDLEDERLRTKPMLGELMLKRELLAEKIAVGKTKGFLAGQRPRP
jgi:transposase